MCVYIGDTLTRRRQIDRRNDYYYVPSLHFPAPNDPTFQKFHIDTLIDGELVLDEEPDGNVLRYLVFDCLVLDGKPLMHRSLDKRLGVWSPSLPLHSLYPPQPSAQLLTRK